MDERAACARRAAIAGGEVALAAFRGTHDVETKAAPTDVVTAADREAQTVVRETIQAAFPGEQVVGEEDDEPSTVPADGPAWIVDPIDGTNNYVRGIQLWATSVAATIDGEVVAGATVCPALDDRYVLEGDAARLNGEAVSVSDRTDPAAFVVAPTLWWTHDRRTEYGAVCRGIVERFGDLRRYGSAQLALALCATGGLEAVVTTVRGHPWDTVVGCGLVRAAGGTVTDVDGEPWTPGSRGLVASNGRAHDLVLEAVRVDDGAR